MVLDLTRNHRSTANIIAVANTLLEDGRRGIVPAKDEGDVPLVRVYDTDAEEAEHVATWLAAKHQPGSPWRSMAVLARTNAQLELVAGYLDAASIPNERRGPEHSPASDLTGARARRATLRRARARRRRALDDPPRQGTRVPTRRRHRLGRGTSCPTTTPRRPNSWPKSSDSPTSH